MVECVEERPLVLVVIVGMSLSKRLHLRSGHHRRREGERSG
jgi:hypothetical protein